jgi:hypothetical protein
LLNPSHDVVAREDVCPPLAARRCMYVLDLGGGLGGASRYLAAECGCRVAAIDLTPNFVEVARVLTAHLGNAGMAAAESPLPEPGSIERHRCFLGPRQGAFVARDRRLPGLAGVPAS